MALKMKTFLILFSLFALAFGNQHLVCKTIDDVFSPNADSGPQLTTRGRHGLPGKRGIPGAPGGVGLPGPPGPECKVDYQRISEMIDERVERGLAKVTENFQKLLEVHSNQTDTHGKILEEITTISEGLAESTTDQIITKESICRDQDGLFYNGVCYIAILEESNKAGATEKCRRIRGVLAEIHTREHETALMEYIRPKLSSWHYFWVGMEYHHPNVLYRSGKEIRNEQFKWKSNYPSSSVGWTNMYFLVHSSKNSDDGLKNNHYDYDYFYTICEKSI